MRIREWPNGTPIVVFVMGDASKQHRSFVKGLLAMFPHQLRRNWDRYIYTGLGQAPLQVHDEVAMIRKVRSTPGAIGYITEELTDDTIHVISAF